MASGTWLFPKPKFPELQNRANRVKYVVPRLTDICISKGALLLFFMLIEKRGMGRETKMVT